MRRAVHLSLIAALLLLGGCGKSAEALAQEAADMAELQATMTASRELDESLDMLEVRLHNGRASIKLWAELADRHREVSEIACQNAEMHSTEMAAIERRDRRRAESLRRNRVAQATRNAVSDAEVSGYKYKAKSAAPGQPQHATP